MQKDPFIHQYRAVYVKPLITLLIVLIMAYYYILFLTYLLNITTIFSLLPWQFFLCMLLILAFVFYIGGRSIWDKRTALRKRALAADPSVLATPQPTPNPYNPLPLPTTIVLQPEIKRLRRYILRQAISLLIIFVSCFIILHTLDAEFFYIPLFAVIIPFILIPSIIWISQLQYARSPRAQYRIEATEQALTISHLGKSSSIAWQDARLFTVSGFNQRHLPLFYELSSKQNSLLWMQVLPGRVLRIHKYLAPIIPFEEYTNKMQALHALIATHTQLPLYDLRSTTQKTMTIITTNPQ